MKQDGRFGEKIICPTVNFDDVCSTIFKEDSKYNGDPQLHPLREPLFKFAQNLTPGAAEQEDPNAE
jgi:hypothetical protein